MEAIEMTRANPMDTPREKACANAEGEKGLPTYVSNIAIPTSNCHSVAHCVAPSGHSICNEGGATEACFARPTANSSELCWRPKGLTYFMRRSLKHVHLSVFTKPMELFAIYHAMSEYSIKCVHSFRPTDY